MFFVVEAHRCWGALRSVLSWEERNPKITHRKYLALMGRLTSKIPTQVVEVVKKDATPITYIMYIYIYVYVIDLSSQGASQLLPGLPQEYQKWVPVVTRWTCKAIAISLAWCGHLGAGEASQVHDLPNLALASHIISCPFLVGCICPKLSSQQISSNFVPIICLIIKKEEKHVGRPIAKKTLDLPWLFS